LSRSIRVFAGGLAALALATSLASTAAADDAAEKGPEPPVQFHASLADGVGFKTAQDRFALDAGALTRTRFDAIADDTGLAKDGFSIAMARPYFRARAFHDQLKLFVQAELAGDPKLLDLEVTWQPMPELGVRVGQFLTPFTRAFLTPVPLLQFPDFSRVNDAFRQNRDTGAMIFGATGGGRLEYYLGVFNGNGINKANDDTSVMGIGRVAVNPLRPMTYDETPSLRGPVPVGLAIGLNGTADRAHPMTTTVDPTTGATTTVPAPPETRLRAGVDVAFVWDRFTFLAEGFARQTQPDQGKRKQGFGAYAQAGYFVVPKRLELAARGGFIDPDASADSDTQRNFEALVNGYVVGNHLKMGLRYMWLRADAPTADGYAAGTSHRVTLQMQLWI